MAIETPEQQEQEPFSQLTVELVERAANLAGERLSAPIRSAGVAAARLMFYSACAAALFVLGLVFAGFGIALLISRAPEGSRWWISLAVAIVLLLISLAIAAAGFRRKTRKEMVSTGDRRN